MRLSLQSAGNVSLRGMLGFGQWISRRSTSESRSRTRLSLADLALVVVHFRGVDVAVAETQRLLHHARAGAPAQVPGAETDQRNAGAMGFHHLCFSGRHRTSHDFFALSHFRTGKPVPTFPENAPGNHLPSASSRNPSKNRARRAVSRLAQNAVIGDAIVP